MTTVGQTATWRQVRATSALPPIADIRQRVRHVADVPEADVDLRADTEHSRAILQRPLSGWSQRGRFHRLWTVSRVSEGRANAYRDATAWKPYSVHVFCFGVIRHTDFAGW